MSDKDTGRQYFGTAIVTKFLEVLVRFLVDL